MDAPKEMRKRADLRDYLAAERPFLAWIRTGLALMGFGFVVARFGAFLQQFQVSGRPRPNHHMVYPGASKLQSPGPKMSDSSVAGVGGAGNGHLSGLRTRFYKSSLPKH